MAVLVWDVPGSRVFESGVDKGVLFLPDGKAVPWNGLVSVTEKFNRSSNPIYFDGMKINDLVVEGDFSGSLKAITYPNEFIELEGFVQTREGMYVGNQHPKSFSLCYRSQIGNDVIQDAGYKLHILYNVIAIPADRAYNTFADSLALTEFEWDIEAIPERVTGFRPTAHVVIDSRLFDEALLVELEKMLYGTEFTAPVLMSLSSLITFLDTWYAIEFIDHGDGSFTAVVQHGEDVTLGDGTFEIRGVTGVFLTPDTYEVSSSIEAP